MGFSLKKKNGFVTPQKNLNKKILGFDTRFLYIAKAYKIWG